MYEKGVDYKRGAKSTPKDSRKRNMPRKQSLLSPGKVATCQLCVFYIHHIEMEDENIYVYTIR